MKWTALIVCLATGCSFFATHGPRPLPEPPSCSTSPGPPALDALLSLTSISLSVGFGIASEVTDSKEKETQYATTAGLMALTGIVTLVSAGLGGYRVHRCKKATQHYEALQRTYPQPYPPPQPYPQPYPPPQASPQPQPYPQSQPQPYPPPQPPPSPQPSSPYR